MRNTFLRSSPSFQHNLSHSSHSHLHLSDSCTIISYIINTLLIHCSLAFNTTFISVNLFNHWRPTQQVTYLCCGFCPWKLASTITLLCFTMSACWLNQPHGRKPFLITMSIHTLIYACLQTQYWLLGFHNLFGFVFLLTWDIFSELQATLILSIQAHAHRRSQQIFPWNCWASRDSSSLQGNSGHPKAPRHIAHRKAAKEILTHGAGKQTAAERNWQTWCQQSLVELGHGQGSGLSRRHKDGCNCCAAALSLFPLFPRHTSSEILNLIPVLSCDVP